MSETKKTTGDGDSGRAGTRAAGDGPRLVTDNAGLMVVNIGKVLSGDWDYVAADVQAVVDATINTLLPLRVVKG